MIEIAGTVETVGTIKVGGEIMTGIFVGIEREVLAQIKGSVIYKKVKIVFEDKTPEVEA